MQSTVPTSMRVAAIDRFGGPEELRTQTVPVPELGPRDVLIRVEFAGVGAWDTGEREGLYAALFEQLHGTPPNFPYVIGFDGAGTVAAVGDEVTRFAVGDAVYGDRHHKPKGGFYAEYVAIDVDRVHPIPAGLGMEEAGAMPVDGITALIGLDESLALQAGESVMIFGASGGLGHFAVQLAKRMGARVFAVASGADGVAFVERLGADRVVDGRADDVVEAALGFAPDGLDAALLTAGGAPAEKALQVLRQGGRVAYPRGVQPEPEVDPSLPLTRFIGDDPTPDQIAKLDRLIGEAPFEVHIAQTFTLEQAAHAQLALAEHYLGKLVLKV
jgi:NADPH2:quinone reductase